jgi:FKBP-type peptidyl-prolyl cis-trans isomerase FklB
MKFTSMAAALVAAASLSATCALAADAALTTDADKTSYAVGVDIGRNLRSLGSELEVDQMVHGLRDGLKAAKPAIPEAEIRTLMSTYRAELGRKQQEAMQRARVDNKEKGDKFQAEYRQKPGVTVLPNGLMYRVLKEGHGAKPQETSTVTVSYVGRLVDGTEFDASVPGTAAKFKLNSGVIQGWREALVQMPVGSRWEVVMPPSVAYGDRGAGRDIGPASTLVFEIELESIEEAPAAAAPAPAPAPAKP